MKATILKIIRNGLQGDKETMKAYIEMLADEFQAEGDENFAKALRKYAKEDFGKEIKPV